MKPAGLTVLILEARYHLGIADALVSGAASALEKGGVQFYRMAVPGVLDLPGAVAIAAQSDEPFDGYVALGCVIGNGTLHDVQFREATHGLCALGLNGLAIGNGVVMAPDEDNAMLQADAMDAGGEAARGCMALMSLRDRLGYLR